MLFNPLYPDVRMITMRKTSDCCDRTAGSRILVVLSLLAAGLFLIVPVMGHSPADIGIQYDPVTEKLSVTITHVVDDPATHYVNKVQVKHNGRVISDPDYKSQPTKDTFTYTYDLKASPPDVFWVLTTCSRGGTLEKKYEIPYPVAATKEPVSGAEMPVETAAPVPTQQSPIGLLALSGAAAVLLLKKG